MKQHNKTIYFYLSTLMGASLLLGGCQQDLLQRGEEPERAKVEQRSERSELDHSILSGQVVVKLKPSDLQRLRAEGNTSLRSASSEVQSSLSKIGAIAMEPLFTDYPEFRERRHEAGLDRWMIVTFDGKLTSREARQILGDTETFEYVELKYAMAQPESKATPISKEMIASNRTTTSSDFNDPYLPGQWHYFNIGSSNMPRAIAGADINLKEAWQVESGRREVVVCVVDAGIDYQHEDLAGRVDRDRSYSFVIDKKTKEPKGKGQIESKSSDHGTHVAGTIAAINNNGIGVAGIAGGNGEEGSGVTLINAQVFGFKGEKTMPGVVGIVYGADHGAVISQNSWGYIAPGPGKLPEYDKEGMDYFIKNAGCDKDGNQLPDSPMKGGVIIFAAGNDGLEYNNYPGAYEGCISVASMGWGFKKAFYSNFGAYVDITAPGGDQEFGMAAGVLSTIPGNKYGYMQGTSMACPHVSGIAALVVSKFGGKGFTNEMLKERLLSALRPYDIYSFNPILKGKLGAGYIDASIALLEDLGKAPEEVKSVSVTPSYITAQFTWDTSKDADAHNGQAYFYNLYIDTKEIASTKELKPFKVYPDSRGGSQKVKYLLKGINDGTLYHYAIEAVDYFGNRSSVLAKGQFATKENKAPIVTDGLPKGTIQLATNQKEHLTLKVNDPDHHQWSYALKGNLYGIKHHRNGEVIELEITPIQATGEHKVTLVLTDEYGKSTEEVISYHISMYQAVTPLKNLSEQRLSVGNKGEVKLTTLFKYQEGATLTFTARSERPDVVETTITGETLSYTAKAKGRVIIMVTASDGITSSQVPLHFMVK